VSVKQNSKQCYFSIERTRKWKGQDEYFRLGVDSRKKRIGRRKDIKKEAGGNSLLRPMREKVGIIQEDRGFRSFCVEEPRSWKATLCSFPFLRKRKRNGPKGGRGGGRLLSKGKGERSNIPNSLKKKVDR